MSEPNVLNNPAVRDLEAGVYLRGGIYALINPQMGTNRHGGQYLKCLLQDSTGQVAGRKWKVEDFDLDACRSTGFVRLDGEVVEFNGQPQINIHDIEPEQVAESDLRQLLPHTRHDVDTMFAEVVGLLESLSHPAMRALGRRYLEDQALMNAFRRSPAAMVMHHAWIGSLLEHTWQMMKLADAMLPCYVTPDSRPRINRDIVLMGLFLHDLAKTAELSWQKGFNYTTEGNLVGHIARGAIWLESCATDLDPPLPDDSLAVLQNIILSHHGEPEHGALRPPMTVEAIFVAQLDNLDARVAMALASVDPEGTGRAAGGTAFTERHHGLGTRLYRLDPLPEV